MSINQQRPYRSYLLRLWRVYQDGYPIWHASLESAQTGEVNQFANLRELTHYLVQQVRAADQQYEEEVVSRLLKD
ncbi:MAG: hypothetical protein U0350_16445 [Caldilineaceae bacterium]